MIINCLSIKKSNLPLNSSSSPIRCYTHCRFFSFLLAELNVSLCSFFVKSSPTILAHHSIIILRWLIASSSHSCRYESFCSKSTCLLAWPAAPSCSSHCLSKHFWLSFPFGLCWCSYCSIRAFTCRLASKLVLLSRLWLFRSLSYLLVFVFIFH